MITNIEQLLQDYARYSFMECTIDENTMNHLIEDAQNYLAKLSELKLLSLHNVSQQRELLKAFGKSLKYKEVRILSDEGLDQAIEDFLSL